MVQPARCRVAVLAALAFWLLGALAAPAAAQSNNAQYYYDADGRLVGMIVPGTGTGSGSAVYSYDLGGNITAVTQNPPTTAVVVQFLPTTGPASTTVTIAGTFGSTASTSNTSVKFNGTAATLSAVSANSITVAVPSGATTGPISVTSPNGTVVTTGSNFTVATPPGAPTISSFSLTTLSTGVGGTSLYQITISGTNFDTQYSKVFVNGQQTQIVSATSTSIVATLPLAVSAGHIMVMTPSGSVTSSSILDIPPPTQLASNVSSYVIATPGTPVTTTACSGCSEVILLDLSSPQTLGVYFSTVRGNWALYGPNGISLGSLDMWGEIYPQMLPAGTYSLSVSNGDSDGGSTVQYFAPPADLTVPVTFGTSNTVHLTTAGQAVDFTFAGTAGNRVDLFEPSYFTSKNCLYSKLIYPDGASSYSGSGAGGGFDLGPVVLPETGNYIIHCSIPMGLTLPQTLTATVYSVPSDVTGTMTEGGSPESFNITTPGQIATFTFAGTAGDIVSVYANGSTLNEYSVTLSGPPNGTPVWQSVFESWSPIGPEYSGPQTLPTTGTYTISFVPMQAATWGTFTGSQTLSLYKVPATVPQTVTPGTTATVATTAPGQQGELDFVGSANQVISLWSAINSSLAGSLNQYDANSTMIGCCQLTLVDPTGNVVSNALQVIADSNVGPWTSYPIVLPITSSSPYKILYNPGIGTGTATFNLNNLSSGSSGSITASPSGSPVTEAVSAAGQSIALAYTATTVPETVSLLVQQSGSLNAADCPSVGLYGPSPSTAWLYNYPYYDSNGCSSGTVFSGRVTVPSAGTFTVFYSPANSATGNVTFTLYSITDITSPNLTPGTSSSPSVQPYTISTPGQVLGVQMTTSSTTSLSMAVDSTFGSMCYRVTLSGISTGLYDQFMQCGGSGFSWTFTSPDTYYVDVQSVGQATGTVTITTYSY